MEKYETSGGFDIQDDPKQYQTEIEFYKDKITLARTLLDDVVSAMVTFFNPGEPDGAGFLGGLMWQRGNYVNDPGRVSKGHELYARWDGPHLRVYKDFSQLYWTTPETGDELWVDMPFCNDKKGEGNGD